MQMRAKAGLWAAQAPSRVYLTHPRSLSEVGQRWVATTKPLCAPWADGDEIDYYAHFSETKQVPKGHPASETGLEVFGPTLIPVAYDVDRCCARCDVRHG